MTDPDPADRIRTLLLRADNLLKNEGDAAVRIGRARETLEEARAVAAQADAEPRIRELIDRRLIALDALGDPTLQPPDA